MRTEGIWLRFLSGPDIESLGISRSEIIEAVADVVTAHGRGQLLWHRGLSILDVAVANLILERAVAADTGTMLRYH